MIRAITFAVELVEHGAHGGGEPAFCLPLGEEEKS
jgi:hypothetical protein